MTDSREILLTNDDGIDSPGIRALYDALSEVGNVTTVAPADDQSAVGRAMTYEVPVEEHELGYAVGGTPSDCVVAGLAELGPYPDIVVSGCNKGANIGAYVLGRSGTVSAAVEAAFFGVPAIAASLHIPQSEWPRDTTVEEYAEVAEAVRYLVERAPDAGVFEQAEYLNVNGPLPRDAGAVGDRGGADGGVRTPMEVTRPSHVYDMDATEEDGVVTLHDQTWGQLEGDTLSDPEGTDRRAVFEGKISVSPLTAPHTTERHDALDDLAEQF
ncbi:5'/3'-nucleotidase SurE [Halorussus gelatinilyticus]|uniref:5'-nucleotidase SurE n=1 Tax=Halorussus gelatinilyticus TaxID=2937524 RepID=A0A8U0IHD6_9EURY|nr:5'/3'-nucleotidase SurE [Halorussus gelatinilyticus]UPW00487.1 5'/3'-nucleotidase SurE [Halorussus gelatinilyticus]